MSTDNEWIHLLVEIAGIIVTVIIAIVSSNWRASVVFCIITFLFFFLGLFLFKYIELIRYISFVEYLIYNKSHKFALLPKARMYIQILGKNNVIVDALNAQYTIKPSDGNDDKNMYGDMSIEYTIRFINRRLPNKYQFVLINDFSNKNMRIEYKYGSMEEYQSLNANIEQLAPYWAGAIRLYDIGLENEKLTQGKTIDLNIRVNCEKSFDFYNLRRDTIVCLPLAFGKRVDAIEYKIDVSSFGENQFYCDAWRIYEKNLRYDRSNMDKKEVEKNIFVSKFAPSSLIGEQAYYFRIGLSETDMEYMC